MCECEYEYGRGREGEGESEVVRPRARASASASASAMSGSRPSGLIIVYLFGSDQLIVVALVGGGYDKTIAPSARPGTCILIEVLRRTGAVISLSLAMEGDFSSCSSRNNVGGRDRPRDSEVDMMTLAY